jgi:hypothetical protein
MCGGATADFPGLQLRFCAQYFGSKYGENHETDLGDDSGRSGVQAAEGRRLSVGSRLDRGPKIVPGRERMRPARCLVRSLGGGAIDFVPASSAFRPNVPVKQTVYRARTATAADMIRAH